MRLFLILLLTCGFAHAQTPSIQDSDGDGLLDREEDINGNGLVDEGETDPFNADSDDGGEADGSEIKHGRNPLDRKDDITYDTDNDGLKNVEEELIGTDMANPDTDGDGINDFDDPFPLDNAYKYDNDHDGLPDEYETEHGLSGADPSDALHDNDEDDLNNKEEFIQGTDPNDPDTDKDGKNDGIEVAGGDDPQENACLLYVNPLAQFEDMQGHWAEQYIALLHNTKVLPDHLRIVDGMGDGPDRRFLPNQPASRFELLKLSLLSGCIRLAKDKERLSVSFDDLPSESRPHDSEEKILRRRVVYTAVRNNIVEGYEDGTFRPDSAINRAEALKILLRASGVTPPKGYHFVNTFSDVPEDSWFSPYVLDAIQLGLVEGYEDGTFRPDSPITRAEAAKIVYLLMVTNPRINGYVIPTEEL